MSQGSGSASGSLDQPLRQPDDVTVYREEIVPHEEKERSLNAGAA